MHPFALKNVSDESLLSGLAALVAADRQTTAALLAHIAEFDARGLYLPAACSSMHVYCTRVLHFSDDAAYKRIRAARLARRFPQILDAIAAGRLHLAGVVLLAPHVTDENIDSLLASATHRSKAEIEMLVALIAPRPDVPTKITPVRTAPVAAQVAAPVPVLAPDAAPVSTTAVAPAPVAESSSLPQLAPGPVAPRKADQPARVEALAPERFKLQMTIRAQEWGSPLIKTSRAA
jgi:hypothetical protein